VWGQVGVRSGSVVAVMRRKSAQRRVNGTHVVRVGPGVRWRGQVGFRITRFMAGVRYSRYSQAAPRAARWWLARKASRYSAYASAKARCAEWNVHAQTTAAKEIVLMLASRGAPGARWRQKRRRMSRAAVAVGSAQVEKITTRIQRP